MGPKKTYYDRDGLAWKNDCNGNSQHAFYKCLEECEQGN
jgi:hypothetical protein